jgi:hypothetical protein
VIVSNCPLRLSSLTGACRDGLSAAAAADGPARPRLREWLASVPDPRSLPGRRHPLEFVLALAVCAFTAAGHDSPSAIADWAAGCSQETLAALGGRRDPWTRPVRPPCERTFRRVFSKVDEAALNDAVQGYLATLPQAAQDELPEPARREREQRRAPLRPQTPPRPACCRRPQWTAWPSAARAAPAAAGFTCCRPSTSARAARWRSGKSAPRQTRSPSLPRASGTWTWPGWSSRWTPCTSSGTPPA